MKAAGSSPMRRTVEAAVSGVLCLAVALLAPEAADGSCAPFRRGDANADGKIDIADGIATISYLFLGGEAGTCRAAADFDDSSTLDITDPVLTFQWLFLGGPPPPDPGPDRCARDPTDDALLCFSYPPCAPETKTEDRSEFARFEYTQTPGLGFCPTLDAVFSAVIESEPGGGHLLRMTVLKEGVPGVDPCLRGFIGDASCPFPSPLPDRRLRPDELEVVKSVFSGLLVHQDHDPLCNCIAFDPCVFRVFQWDAVKLNGFLCSERYLDGGTVDALLALLETLRAG